METSQVKDLSTIGLSEFKEFLDSFDDVLCDCDGVMWYVEKLIPGAKETVSKLKECGKRIRFVSNNGFFGIERYRQKFKAHQIDASADDVAYPTLAMIEYLKSIGFSQKIVLLGSSYMEAEFVKSGFQIAKFADTIEENLSGVLEVIEHKEDIGAVIVDIDINVTYMKLLKCLLYLRQPNVLFITGATDDRIPVGQDKFVIGSKHFKDCLNKLSGRAPLAFGKPGPLFHEYITKKFDIKCPSRTLFVGDSLKQDMEFASRYGYQKLLVMTGVTDVPAINAITDKKFIPNFYISSFGELHRLIKKCVRKL